MGIPCLLSACFVRGGHVCGYPWPFPSPAKGPHLPSLQQQPLSQAGTPGAATGDLELELRVPGYESTHPAAVQAFNIKKSVENIFLSLACFIYSIFCFIVIFSLFASKNFYEVLSFLISFKLTVRNPL